MQNKFIKKLLFIPIILALALGACGYKTSPKYKPKTNKHSSSKTN